MIQKGLVVSDTNIFLDLISVDLMDEFFELPFEIFSTDFVIDEIKKPEEREFIQRYIDHKKLKIRDFEFNEIIQISNLEANCGNNASFPDCSVWYLAKKIKGILLTGDAKLRRVATADNVKVSGILFVFDKLVEYDVIDHQTGAERLKRLLQINIRLPRSECVNRIEMWQNIRKTT
ncbi:MAG: hypothetical protein MJ057_04450 [Sphaerochaetaceae bacterium]|nr:hypothetical protein [Sphaerochaetaceae bacterium]